MHRRTADRIPAIHSVAGPQVRRLLAGVLALGLLAVVGCNSSGKPTQSSQYSLTIGAALSANADLANTQARVSLTQSGQTNAAGPVVLNADTLTGGSGAYSRQYGTTAGFVGATHALKFFDGTNLVSQVSMALPGTPSISVVNPANRIYTGGQNVTINFTMLGSGATGHVLAAVKATQAYAGIGYVTAPIGSSSGIIPPDAFRVGGTGALDTGKYYIYAYAYTGEPGVTGLANLPTVLPSSFFDQNLSTATTSGNYGGIVVSRRDSLFVRIN